MGVWGMIHMLYRILEILTTGSSVKKNPKVYGAIKNPPPIFFLRRFLYLGHFFDNLNFGPAVKKKILDSGLAATL